MGKRLQLSVLFAAMLLISGCVPGSAVSETPEGTPVVLPDGAIAIGARELFDYFKEDTAAADTRFKGKILEVTGSVTASRQMFGSHYIVMGGLSFMWTWGIHCQFSDSSDPRLTGLSRGDTVRVRGRCEGLIPEVVLKDCQLVASEKKE